MMNLSAPECIQVASSSYCFSSIATATNSNLVYLSCTQVALKKSVSKAEPQRPLDRSFLPILATQASPGMGKSSFIDLLGSLTVAQVQELSPALATKEFCRLIGQSQRVVVDYKFGQPVTDFDLKHPEAGLACRVLHSYVTARKAHYWPCYTSLSLIFCFRFCFVQVFWG